MPTPDPCTEKGYEMPVEGWDVPPGFYDPDEESEPTFAMASETKWPRTPGEWTAEAPDYVWVSVSRNGESFDICSCCGETYRPGNAHLIAAAPDLEKVCQDLVQAISEDQSIQNNPEFDCDDAGWFLERARSALAKARGES